MKKQIEDSVDILFEEKSKRKDFIKGIIKNDNSIKSKNILKAFSEYELENNKEFINQDINKIVNKLSHSRKTIFRSILKYAAIALIFLTLGYWLNNNELETVRDINYTCYSTSRNETSKITLADGTKVFLSPFTKIFVPDNFSGNNRNLKMRGQAYFEVKHNPESIFNINSGKYKVQVLGTKFNIKAYPKLDYISTNLIEGKVLVDLSDFPFVKNQRIIMKPGENLCFNKSSYNYKLRKYSDNIIIDWANGTIRFEDKKFGNIIKDLNLYYNTNIQIESKKLFNYKFNGVFNNRNIYELLNILQKITAFNIETKNENIIIKEI
jgi:ferric-dicitrate binding protein FerR (iron transport regulator)